MKRTPEQRSIPAWIRTFRHRKQLITETVGVAVVNCQNTDTRVNRWAHSGLIVTLVTCHLDPSFLQGELGKGKWTSLLQNSWDLGPVGPNCPGPNLLPNEVLQMRIAYAVSNDWHLTFPGKQQQIWSSIYIALRCLGSIEVFEYLNSKICLKILNAKWKGVS